MTAEIAIMNKQAIALASDSAVTMSQELGEKIKTSANKLFALSKYHPVGVMVFGNADLMAVPWETIIKVYRAKLDKKKFDTLREYADDFITFLDNGNPMFPDNVQKEYLLYTIYSYFYFIEDQIEKMVESVIFEKGKVIYDEIKQITSNLIKEHYEIWKKSDTIPSISISQIKEIKEKYEENIVKAIDDVFQKLPLSKLNLDQLKEIGIGLFSKFPKGIHTDDTSGIVIAGFGEKETFPSLIAYDIEGIANNKLKFKESLFEQISFDNDASINAFAQKEMVVTFMEGVDPFYMVAEQTYLVELFNKYYDMIIKNIIKGNDNKKERIKKKLQESSEKMLLDHQKKLENYRQENHIDPVTSVVSMLPKDELAAMAETLVNLTSFARKVKLGPETVGGPIDVAVISKGDGFIWIKRKHYFKQELNPQFFAKYYKEEIKYGET